MILAPIPSDQRFQYRKARGGRWQRTIRLDGRRWSAGPPGEKGEKSMKYTTFRPLLLSGVTAVLSILPGTGLAQDKLPPLQPAPDVEVLPSPRTANPSGNWEFTPHAGEWIDPHGMRWMFDGLRWRVLWQAAPAASSTWYPVIPPGPLPCCWRTVDFGSGWLGVLTCSSSKWHLVPPSLAHMPPPWALPEPAPPPCHARHSSWRAGFRACARH